MTRKDAHPSASQSTDSALLHNALLLNALLLLTDNLDNEQTIQNTRDLSSLLASWHMPLELQLAGLLLPIIRHGVVMDDVLIEGFGHQAVDLARRVNRVLYAHKTMEIDPKATRESRQREKLRDFFVHAYTDVYIALLIIALRLIEARSVGTLSAQERQVWADENIAVYLPLLELLGLWHHRRDLGDLSLRLSSPTYYRQLERHIARLQERQHALSQQLIDTLLEAFEEQAIHNALVSLHELSPVTINQRTERAQRRGIKVDPYSPNEASMMGIDVIVENVRDCYHALGLIHNRWKPAIRPTDFRDGRLLDYIAEPRYNGFRCLITTVHCEDPASGHKVLVEFRIRDQQMEEVNAHGIVAALRSGRRVRNAWWQDETAHTVIRAGQDGADPETVAVFTPTGEVMYPFKPGSTMVDVAFRVHSSLGPCARRFWANGQPRTYKYVLQHRDLVEVDYDHQFPSLLPEWEGHARASSTRTSIRRFLRAQERSPHKGRQRIDEVLAREMDIYQMHFPEDKIDTLLKQVAMDHQCPTREMLYMKVLDGELSPDDVVARLIELELVRYILPTDGSRLNPKQVHIARTWMQEPGARKWDPSTRVMPGVEIVGRYVQPGSRTARRAARLAVYRADSPYAPPPEEAVALHWQTTGSEREVAEITVTAPPRSAAIRMVLNAMTRAWDDEAAAESSTVGGPDTVNVQKLSTEMHEGSLAMQILVDAPSKDVLTALLEQLNTLQRMGYITRYRVWQLFPGQRIQMTSRMDRRWRNPFTLSLIKDQSMFFGREQEVARIIDQVKQGGNFIIVYGQQRIGKSSLIYQLAEYDLPQYCQVMTVFMDAQSVIPFTLKSFLMGLANQTMIRLSERLRRPEDRRSLRLNERDLEQGSIATAFVSWVRRVEERLNGTRLMFVVDEFTRAEEACKQGGITADFFNALHYMVEDGQVGFLLCLHEHVYHQYSCGGNVYQRAESLRLDSLQPEAAIQLIAHPLGSMYSIEDAAIEAILSLTGCHPYFIQGLCMDIVQLMFADENATVITLDHVYKATNVFLRERAENFFYHYKMQLKPHDAEDARWDVLRAIAFKTTEDSPWVNRAAILEGLAENRVDVDRMNFAIILGDLKRGGFIVAEVRQGEAWYRIPVGLFRSWLQVIVTHPIVIHDIHRTN